MPAHRICLSHEIKELFGARYDAAGEFAGTNLPGAAFFTRRRVTRVSDAAIGDWIYVAGGCAVQSLFARRSRLARA
jgi:hypothetical protein